MMMMKQRSVCMIRGLEDQRVQREAPIRRAEKDSYECSHMEYACVIGLAWA